MIETNRMVGSPVWHVLDVRAIWIKEFASALGGEVPTLGWLPSIRNTGRLENWEREEAIKDPSLCVRHFPLQRGFARAPVTWLAHEGKRLSSRLTRQAREEKYSPLICCSPHYVDVARRWHGPVIYYVTDLFVTCGEDGSRIRSFDRRMCAVADLVCPNSHRIADYLRTEANCSSDKIRVIPNATRAANLLPAPSSQPAELPLDIAELPRPVAGVLGNLANNIDWLLLHDVIDQTPWLSWAFIGPAEMPVLEAKQERARSSLMARRGRIRFAGLKPYGLLRNYARAFDVAVLPYRKIEPTYSGSSTRFYEHLATCRPMLATRGFEELLHKEPLLRLTDSSKEMVAALEELNRAGFRDGFEEARWKASRKETWEERASAMKGAVMQRCPRLYEVFKEVA